MRVVVVNQHLRDAVGGSELQCDLVARWLVERGHAVRYVAVSTAAGAESPRDVVQGDDPEPYELIRAARSPAAVLAAIRAGRPDVVYWRFNRSMLAGVVRGLRRDGTPLVLATAHIDDVSRWPTRTLPRGLGARGLIAEARQRTVERRSWSALRRVTAIAAQREDFLWRAPVEDQRLIRNVVDPSREAFVWPRPYVAWVGSLQQRKRPELAVPVAAALEPHGVDLLMAGQVREQRYAALLADPALPRTLHHLGVLPAPRVAGLLDGARALLLTAREEGLSNVLIQAAWFGTPVISVDYDPDGLLSSRGLGRVAGGDPTELVRLVREVAAADPPIGERQDRARVAARLFSSQNLVELEVLLRDAVSRG